jgi:hypothetical protein
MNSQIKRAEMTHMSQADTNNTNIHPLRQVQPAILRKRKSRAKQRDQQRDSTVRAEPVTSVTSVTPRGLTSVTLAAALGLATVSAGFSITGLTSIFVGAFWPVIGMGIALEVGKLSAVAWLGRHQGTALKVALALLVAVLMTLNAVGAYGFLAQAHISHAVVGEVATLARGADVAARLSVQAGVVADIDRRIAQIDGAVEKTTAKGRTAAAMSLARCSTDGRSQGLGDPSSREGQDGG